MTELAKIDTQEYSPPAQSADPMVSLIERIVMDPDASIDKLERMLEMRERIQKQQAKAAYDNAIASAKSEIPPILKTGTVDYTTKSGDRTHFKHETLDGIANVVDPILSANGLSYRFRSKQEEGRLHVTCVVAHRDGYAEETTLSGAPDTSGSKNNYQAVGSAATYLQRYTLKLALGLSAAKDDDAVSSEGSAPLINAEQFQTLNDLMDKAQADEGKMLQFLKADILDELTVKQFDTAVSMLRKKIAQKNAEGGDT